MAIQSVVANHLWPLISLTPFLRLPKRLVRSTCSKFLNRSFRSELKWEGKRTCRTVKAVWESVFEPSIVYLVLCIFTRLQLCVWAEACEWCDLSGCDTSACLHWPFLLTGSFAQVVFAFYITAELPQAAEYKKIHLHSFTIVYFYSTTSQFFLSDSFTSQLYYPTTSLLDHNFEYSSSPVNTTHLQMCWCWMFVMNWGMKCSFMSLLFPQLNKLFNIPLGLVGKYILAQRWKQGCFSDTMKSH